jgi:amino acid adenylation domain-containing protein
MLYEALAAGRPAPLAALPVQYLDYAVWQRGWLAGEVLERQLGYWRGQLAGAAHLALPTDRPRPAVQLLRGGGFDTRFSSALSLSLQQLGRRRSASLFMTLLAAFQALLHRYSGQPDVVVGSPVANRDHKELEGLIGLFLNTLALRSRPGSGDSFAAFLGQVRKTVLSAYAHQDLPFEKLVDQLQVERDLSGNPLFQVVFDFHSSTEPLLQLGDRSVRRLSSELLSTRFDLELHMALEAEGLWVSLAFDAELFDGPTIERLAGHFRNLLEGAARNPEERISRLPLLGTPELDQVLRAWNGAPVDYDQEICLHELFTARAERTPQAVAVVEAGRSLTYGELNAWSNRLARRLIDLGVGPETRVGVCIDRSLEMVVCLLGVLKAGGAYVPIDPAYPRDRIAFILADVGASLCLTRSTLAAGLSGLGSLPVCVDPDECAGWAPESPPPRARAENTAYVIFTSGSTGRPKGVVLQHRPVVNLITWVNGTFNVGPEDRVLQVASLCFDLSVYDVFGLLAAGGSLRVANEEESRDPERLARILDEGTITLWDSAPAALQQLVPFLPGPGAGSPNLRLALLSGDWIPLTLPPSLRRSYPEVEVIALGGATEAAIWSNHFAVREIQPDWASIPYGRAIQNARYYVLDGEMQHCPAGVAGDLYIGGECLSTGYFGRPDLTAER